MHLSLAFLPLRNQQKHQKDSCCSAFLQILQQYLSLILGYRPLRNSMESVVQEMFGVPKALWPLLEQAFLISQIVCQNSLLFLSCGLPLF